MFRRFFTPCCIISDNTAEVNVRTCAGELKTRDCAYYQRGAGKSNGSPWHLPKMRSKYTISPENFSRIFPGLGSFRTKNTARTVGSSRIWRKFHRLSVSVTVVVVEIQTPRPWRTQAACGHIYVFGANAPCVAHDDEIKRAGPSKSGSPSKEYKRTHTP